MQKWMQPLPIFMYEPILLVTHNLNTTVNLLTLGFPTKISCHNVKLCQLSYLQQELVRLQKQYLVHVLYHFDAKLQIFCVEH